MSQVKKTTQPSQSQSDVELTDEHFILLTNLMTDPKSQSDRSKLLDIFKVLQAKRKAESEAKKKANDQAAVKKWNVFVLQIASMNLVQDTVGLKDTLMKLTPEEIKDVATHIHFHDTFLRHALRNTGLFQTVGSTTKFDILTQIECLIKGVPYVVVEETTSNGQTKLSVGYYRELWREEKFVYTAMINGTQEEIKLFFEDDYVVAQTSRTEEKFKVYEGYNINTFIFA